MEKDHYDQASTVFSPDGRIFQVEYAREAINRGGLAMALVFKDGVLFVIEKTIHSPLVEEKDLEKFFRIAPLIGAATSGLIADARVLVDLLRDKSQDEKITFDEEADIEIIVEWLSKIYEIYTRYEGVRPFGTSLLVGGKDRSGYHLYETDPSGVFQEKRATAIGKGRLQALEIMAREYEPGMDRDSALILACRALRATMKEGEKDDLHGVEFHQITEEGFSEIRTAEIRAVVKTIMASEKKSGKGGKRARAKQKRTEMKVKKGSKGAVDPGAKEAAGVLKDIPKLNKKTVSNILKRYPTLDDLTRANLDDLMDIDGVGRATAERILKALRRMKSGK